MRVARVVVLYQDFFQELHALLMIRLRAEYREFLIIRHNEFDIESLGLKMRGLIRSGQQICSALRERKCEPCKQVERSRL